MHVRATINARQSHNARLNTPRCKTTTTHVKPRCMFKGRVTQRSARSEARHKLQRSLHVLSGLAPSKHAPHKSICLQCTSIAMHTLGTIGGNRGRQEPGTWVSIHTGTCRLSLISLQCITHMPNTGTEPGHRRDQPQLAQTAVQRRARDDVGPRQRVRVACVYMWLSTHAHRVSRSCVHLRHRHHTLACAAHARPCCITCMQTVQHDDESHWAKHSTRASHAMGRHARSLRRTTSRQQRASDPAAQQAAKY